MLRISFIGFSLGLLVSQISGAFLRTKSAFNAPSGRRTAAEPCGCDLDTVSGYCKPAFLVIGVQKSGTSTMYQLMKQNPNIAPPIEKELLWFNGDQEHLRCAEPGEPSEEEFGLDYLKQFPHVSAGSVITGEWSASYFHCSCCPAAFQRLMPQARLIVVLRDPVLRAISRYDEQEEFGNEPKYESIDVYVDTELPKLEKCLEEADEAEDSVTNVTNVTNVTERLRKRFECAGHENILGFSLYPDALQSWLANFENLLVTYTDDLDENPDEVLASIEDFLGLPHYAYNGTDKVFNRAGDYGWDNAMERMGPSELTIERLSEFYTPSVKALKELADEGKIKPMPERWQIR